MNKFWKNFAIYQVAMLLIYAAAFYIQTIGKIDTGRSIGSIIFVGEMYRYNILTYLLGIILYLGLMIVLYIKLLKPNMRALIEAEIIHKILTIAITIIVGIMMFVVEMIIMLYVFGLCDSIEPEYAWIFSAFGLPIIYFLYFIFNMIMNRKRSK